MADTEDALTFLNNSLYINVLRVSLVLSAISINEATAPIASGAAGNASSGDQGLLGSTVALLVALLMLDHISSSFTFMPA